MVTTDRRTQRRADTRAEIVAAAWVQARHRGLAALSMRDLGAAVGMRAQSLYSYVDSKHGIYDRMFQDSYEAFAVSMDATADRRPDPAQDPVGFARATAHGFVAFCVADPVRYQLMFQRPIPGFVPSQQAYSVSQSVLARVADDLASIGVTDPEALDLATALFSGLTAQQIANDPDGDRWVRLVDRAVDMWLAEVAPLRASRSDVVVPGLEVT